MSLFRYRNRTSKWFIFILRPLLWAWLKWRFKIEIRMPDEIREKEGPFLLIGNHVTFWDPFLIGIPIKPDTRYITSDNIFRTRFYRWVMARVGAIPKTKFVANADIVRRIVGVIKQKGAIGIFPEARRTWDGRTIQLVPQVSKLVKRLKLPVVAAKIHGGYLSGPRWGRYGRKGKVIIEYTYAVRPEEAGELSLEEVEQRMADGIRFRADIWQKEAQIAFRGRRIAEYLERVLFICPHCHTVGSLHSDHNLLMCRNCEYTVEYATTGRLLERNRELKFESVADWNLWQSEHLDSLLESIDGSPLYSDEGARLWIGYQSKPMQLIDGGRVELVKDALVFNADSGSVRRFPLMEIEGANVQNGEKFEFYWNKELYRLDFVSPRTSSYKWLLAILKMQDRAWELTDL